jgi:SnoaL-like domain
VTRTQDSSAALTVAMAYYQAWTTKDVDRAMTYVADDVVCEAPSGRIVGIERYRPFVAGFAQMVTSADLLAAFGDDETALLLYDPHTTLVESAPTAERITVRDGRIVHSLLVFDQTPFIAARQAAT